MKNIHKLKPFTKFCMTLGMIPSSYKASPTYEEQLLWFCDFLETKVIPTVNNNAEAVIELQNYIKDYFENLDVQEEINQKLDEMVSDGTLAEIINQEIFEDLNTEINNLDEEINDIKSSIHKTYFENRKFILIGDSYANGFTPDGDITSWQELFVSLTELSNTIQKHLGGTGFVNLAQNKNFQTLLEEVSDDESVTDIVVLGGYNDMQYNQQQIYTAINNFVIKAKQKFPNADIHIGFVGWSNTSNKLYPLSIVCQRYREACGYYMASYLNNIEYSLHNYFSDFSSDGFHPNSSGQIKITRNLIQALMTGSCNNPTPFTQIQLDYNSNIDGTPFGTDLTCKQNNQLISISSTLYHQINFLEPFDNDDGIVELEIGTITNGYIVGNEYGIASTNVLVIVRDSTGYYACNGNVLFKNGKMYVQFSSINDDKNGYRTFDQIDQVQIGRINCCFDALYC